MKLTFYNSFDPRRLLTNTQFKTLADTAFELGQPGEMFELVADQEQSYANDTIQVRRSLKLSGKFKATFELHGRINVTIDHAQIANASPMQSGTIILADDFEGTLAILDSQIKYTNPSGITAIWHQAASDGNTKMTSKLLIKDSTIDGIADIPLQIVMQGKVKLLALANTEDNCNVLSSISWQLNNANLQVKYGYLTNNSKMPAMAKTITCLAGPVNIQGNWDIQELCLDQKEPSESFKFGGSSIPTIIKLKNLTKAHAQSGTSAFYANQATLNLANGKLGEANDHLQASIVNSKVTMNHTIDNLTWILEGANVLDADEASLTSLHQRTNEFVSELPTAEIEAQPASVNAATDTTAQAAPIATDAKKEQTQVDTATDQTKQNIAAKTQAQKQNEADQAAKKDPDKAAKPKPDGMAKLNAMIGLTDVKKKVSDYAEVAKFNAIARERGLQETTGLNRHMIFGGNPGTGKTTVANYIAEILYERHALPSDKFTSAGVRDLVGDHKGETAKATHKIIEDALGGVLLIDEAYRLNDHGDSFGSEAIGELTQVIDDKKYRDNLIIILAGYSKKMKDLLENVNPGFRSRFNTWIEFPDYTTAEKIQIFKKDCHDNGIFINAKLFKTKAFLELLKFYSRDHANGRSVRNLYDSLVQARINRVTPQTDKLNNEQLMTITADDITTVYKEAQKTIKREHQEKRQEQKNAILKKKRDALKYDPNRNYR